MDFTQLINSFMQTLNAISNTPTNTTCGGLLILMAVAFVLGLWAGRSRR
jgi:hypothetical protein